MRLFQNTGIQASFLISEVSPRRGLAAGFVSSDPYNLPFSRKELTQVSESIVQVKAQLASSDALTEEQLDLVVRKLDEIRAGSERFGRKDWMNWAAGTLTGLCISAAFAPEVTKAIFEAMGSAFLWLFTGAVALLR